MQLDLPLKPKKAAPSQKPNVKYLCFKTYNDKQLMGPKNAATAFWCLPNDINQLGGRQLLELPNPQRPQRSRSRLSLEHIRAEHVCASGASCFNVVPKSHRNGFLARCLRKKTPKQQIVPPVTFCVIQVKFRLELNTIKPELISEHSICRSWRF